MRKRMGEQEVENGSEGNDESTVETEVQMSEGPAEVEQGTVSVVVVQAELYHPKRRQPHQELRKRHQDGEAR